MAARLFGTNGIREVVGERLNAYVVTQIAEAIAAACPVGEPVAVGRDGRTSSVAFANIVASTLALAGHQVIELGLLPTPAIQYSVPRVGAQLGVIVTASHNPPEFNGIKCIARDGLEVAREFEERIESGVAARVVASTTYQRIGEVRVDSMGAQRYVEGILAAVDGDAIRRRKFTIVLDCGNGASVPTSPALYRRLGCRVITLNGQVDGTFPGHLSEPTVENVADLRRTVPALGADLGIVHDGDADRAVFVDANGRYIPGEETLTLFGREAVRRHKGGIVVAPVSTSSSLEEVIRPLGGEVVYTRVGSPTVTRTMLERKAVFGGEENGGLVFPHFQYARDGAMSAASMLELLAVSGRPLPELLAELPKFTLVKEKVSCPVPLRAPVLAHLAAEAAAEGGRVVTIDGLKVIFNDGWYLVRPSGTEPLFRVFAESRDAGRAGALAEDGLRRVRSAIDQLGGAGR